MPDRFREVCIRDEQRPTFARRRELGDDLVPIRHEDHFSSGREPHVLAQLVFENLQANGSHPVKVASGSYLSRRPRGTVLAPREGVTQAGDVPVTGSVRTALPVLSPRVRPPCSSLRLPPTKQVADALEHANVPYAIGGAIALASQKSLSFAPLREAFADRELVALALWGVVAMDGEGVA